MKFIKEVLVIKLILTRLGNVGSVIILVNAFCEFEVCDDVECVSVCMML